VEGRELARERKNSVKSRSHQKQMEKGDFTEKLGRRIQQKLPTTGSKETISKTRPSRET